MDPSVEDQTSGQWTVYIVRCSDNTLYTGIAKDPDHRIAEHNSGKGAKYTRSRLPVLPVYREICADHSAALRREAAIKRMTKQEKNELIKTGKAGQTGI